MLPTSMDKGPGAEVVGRRAKVTPSCRDKAYHMACLCDPRIKGSLASHTAELEEWRNRLSSEVHTVDVHGKPGMQGHKEDEWEGGFQESCAGVSSAGKGSSPQYWSSVVS